jgi:glutamate-1-semialdehyde aminotransferase/spore coat polysaccharide biosynthesis protein SpsF (cytidylyltransferase family)
MGYRAAKRRDGRRNSQAMKTVAIIQARMGATRLPGKVLMELGGAPVLAWVTRAAKAVLGVDDIWIATSTNAADDAVANWTKMNNVFVHRGSEHDVLDRYAGAAKASGADIVIRLTADCPFLDPQVVAQTVRLRAVTGVAYASNVDPPTWPDGLDCEVLTAEALFAAAAEGIRLSDREHVTSFVRNNRMRFSAETLIAPLPGLVKERWTLDTPADLKFLSAVADRLPRDRPPSYLDVLAALDREPKLREINRAEQRNAGFAKSLATEKVDTRRSYARSQLMIERAEAVIPLGAQTFSKSKISLPPGASPLFVTHGDGGRVFDVDGNEYVDLIGALLPNVLGYRDCDVDLAIRQQLTRGISFSLSTELEMQLAERLVAHIPCAEMARFGKNGTDATSAAIRLARAATRRDRVMVCGYHGWQDWYIGTTSRNLGVPAAVSALSHIVPYGDLSAVEAILAKYPGEFAAMIVEPAGAVEPASGYLQSLKDLLRRHKTLLIFDEIITGFRWSIGGAQAYYGVVPDLSSFGKAMGNGMPISAVVGRADIMRLMEEVFFSGTFGGEALSLAAANATIDKIEREKVTQRLWQVGGDLKERASRKIADAGLNGVISLAGAAPWAILAYKDHPHGSKEAIKTFFLREMIAAGVLINSSHNVCFSHTEADIAHVLNAYDHALPLLREALDRGDIEQRLGNQVIRPVFSVRATPA